MSDIEVRELAAMVKAPVDVLMRQLKRAGIEVKGPEDRITDAQKLMLLERMNEGESTAKSGAGKITLKRRGDGGAMGLKKGGVDVRRKKSLGLRKSEKEEAIDREAEARAEALARQVDADRQAREAVIQKAEQERREREAIRMRKPQDDARQREAKSAEPAGVEPEPVAAELPATETVAETVATPTHANEQAPAQASAAAVEPAAEQAPAAEEAVAAAPESSASAERAAAAEAPAATETVATQAAAGKKDRKAKVARTENKAGQGNADNDLSPMQQRQVVADAAKQEAAAALKRRPSRTKARAASEPETSSERPSGDDKNATRTEPRVRAAPSVMIRGQVSAARIARKAVPVSVTGRIPRAMCARVPVAGVVVVMSVLTVKSSMALKSRPHRWCAKSKCRRPLWCLIWPRNWRFVLPISSR
ncbi:MAG: hypothetical protein R3E95_17465 [Thiolinea sp.]